MIKEITHLLAKGDKTTWKHFIQEDSKEAAKAMLKCLEIIKNRKTAGAEG